MSSLLKIVGVGSLFTALSSVPSWNYCMGGAAHGVPMAIIRPSHGQSFAAVLLEPESKGHGVELSLLAIGIDIVVWSILAVGLIAIYRRIAIEKDAV